MKKLISAATSLIMAASAISTTVVPFVTGAADASKSFELRAFEGASTKISTEDIAAGKVTVPVGIYYVEQTADTQSLNFQFTVKSANGDASAVTFEDGATEGAALVTAGLDVNAADKEYTVGGSTYTTKKLINFASELSLNAKGATKITLGGNEASSTAASNAKAGTDYAYAGYSWIPSKDGYKWAGATSDEFPVAVVNVTFPQNTKAGTYTLDFCDYEYDPDHPDNMSNMVEVGSTKYTTKNNNLTLKSIDIVIGDEAPVDIVTTTTANQTPATTTTTANQTPATTTTATPSTPVDPSTPSDSKGTPVSDFVVDMNNNGAGYTFTLDELKAKNTFTIPVYVTEMGSHTAAVLIAELPEAPAGFTVDSDLTNYAFNEKAWQDTEGTWYCYTMNGAEPVESLSSEDEILLLEVTVDTATVKPGEYTYTFKRFDVAEDGSGQKEIAPAVIPAVITITDGDTPVEPVTTTTVPATTTTAPATTTTPATTTAGGAATTTATPVGDVLYGDANDDKKVNIADVVVLNKWLNNNADYAITAQGKVNADCCDPKGGDEINSSDSDAIIRSIVHRITLPTDAATLAADQAKD
ncbi:MAG: dockerin type I repeat-containing protein [Ruminococcus sp.]|nr:dockerin type I repeat-containing protein [Ruminococcus sp.]